MPQSCLPSAAIRFYVKAIRASLECDHPLALKFAEGDCIETLRWSTYGWWWGRLDSGDGQSGWFHSCFVQPLAAPQRPCAKVGDVEELMESIDAASCGGDVAPKGCGLLSDATELKSSLPQDMSNFEIGLDTWPPLPPCPAPSAMAPQGLQPPLPPGPPPRRMTLDAMLGEDRSGPDAGAPGSSLPPLPPGPPPLPVHNTQGQPLDDASFTQTMGFLPDGRVVSREPAQEREILQLHNFFNYGEWVRTKALDRRQRQQSGGRMLKDGGFKRRRL